MKFEPLSGMPDGPELVRPEHPHETGRFGLERFIEENHSALEKRLLERGALVFRGFGVHEPEEFERVALRFDPALCSEYLGTSPRDKKSRYVFSASELPGYYPIPQHCEMSFLPDPPRRLFFFCRVAPTWGGETPLVDFRRVYQTMDPSIRDEFESRGVRIIRNYEGPSTPSRRDLWKLKRWDEMFLTEDRAKVEDVCTKNGFQFEWYGRDRLRLVSEQDATRTHPITGERLWFNHCQVFHLSAAAIEYRHIFERRRTIDSAAFLALTTALTLAKRRFVPTEGQAMHCTFRDGAEIPERYIEHVEDTIWRNMVFFPWKLGDVIAIDNYRMSHGRMPYRGPREILIAWTTGPGSAAAAQA